jgi:hypothetical protein
VECGANRRVSRIVAVYRKVTAMTTLRNRFFLEGVLLGSFAGVALGSLIAFQVSNERVTAARRFVYRVVRPKEPSINFSLIRQ